MDKNIPLLPNIKQLQLAIDTTGVYSQTLSDNTLQYGDEIQFKGSVWNSHGLPKNLTLGRVIYVKEIIEKPFNSVKYLYFFKIIN